MSIISLRARSSETTIDASVVPQEPSTHWSAGRMYAIVFDLDTAQLNRHYPGNHGCNAYDDIYRELKLHGFERQQGSVYFGRKGTDSVHCVLATQALDKRFPWFAKSVRDIRMLRVEEHNDLMPAIGQMRLPLASNA